MTVPAIQNLTIERFDAVFSQQLPKIFDLAQWIFGPEGFQQLEVLAYGDFTYRDRQPNILLCRSQNRPQDAVDTSHVSTLSYRQVTKEDRRLWEMIEEHFDLLEACPEDLLMYPWPP